MKQRNIFIHSPYLMDGGLETTLVFHQGIELNEFAAFELLLHREGRKILSSYYARYIAIAKKYNLSFVLETPTWRTNSDWGQKLGYSDSELDAINQDATELMREIAAHHHLDPERTLISGCIGPRADGYIAGMKMMPGEARRYHSRQIACFALADVDLVTALTLNYTEEAIGIAIAAAELNLPVVLSFTLETDGKLPDGEDLRSAIARVEKATESYPEHYMINCAHPEHFREILDANQGWVSRIKGLRANASTKSHAELDAMTELDSGDKLMLARHYQEMTSLLPDLKAYGGCCGTDHKHLEAICETVFSQ